MRKIIYLTLFSFFLAIPVFAGEPSSAGRSVPVFKISFLLSEIRAYSYDKVYAKHCYDQILLHKKELGKQGKSLDFGKIDKLDYAHLSDKAKKVSENFYSDLKDDNDRLEYLYGSIVSSMGVDLASSGRVHADKRADSLWELLHTIQDPTAKNFRAVLDNDRSFFGRDKEHMKRELNEIIRHNLIGSREIASN